MRAALWFLAAILGTLLLAAVLAWPVWQVAHALQPEWPFHKVVSRFWQLLLLAGLVLAVRRLGLRGREDWGFGLARGRFVRHLVAGLAIGLATMLPMTIAMQALGLLVMRPDFSATLLLNGIAAGAVTGLAVAIVEETFFRGLLFRAVMRESGLAAALWSTALLYSAIHFLARARIPPAGIGWDSGITLLGSAFSRFADAASIADSFVALLLVGLMLGLVRHRTGGIAAGIGLHMGWVWVIKSTTSVTDLDAGARWSFLVNSFDGYTGWLVAGWAALLLGLICLGGWLRPAAAGTTR
ncbi:MAG TPA: CPBP family intramembrane glutamic endopeptidase [Steroidobacteraceae bacterium]